MWTLAQHLGDVYAAIVNQDGPSLPRAADRPAVPRIVWFLVGVVLTTVLAYGAFLIFFAMGPWG